MLILNVIEHETIWGGARLVSDGETNKKIGHLYSLITEDNMASVILNGSHAGESFKDYFQKNKAELGMSEYEDFPFVVALVEAADNLSIQVHPNDETAYVLEKRCCGKNESWYFLDTPTSGWIYNGCVCNSVNDLQQLMNDNMYDKLIDTLPVKAGDYVYVEAGTLHAMTCGSLVYEIEENCNLTYRVYDFDRTSPDGQRRELHTDKALRSIDIRKKSIVRQYNNSPITERCYSTQLLENITHYENTEKDLACFTLIDGSCNAEGVEIKKGTSILLLPGENIDCCVKTAIVARPILRNRHKINFAP